MSGPPTRLPPAPNLPDVTGLAAPTHETWSSEPAVDLRPTYATTPPPAPKPTRRQWRTAIILFILTLLSTFVMGGPIYALAVMFVLTTHELGHFLQARRYRVAASLPYFLPMPISPIGTMGAVISMPKRIESRNALMDIGAAGPLAGIVVAIPVLIIGLAQSEVKPLTGGGMTEGQCLLYWLLKRLVVGEIPAGHDVFLTSTAFAGWAGLLVTALNLIPIGQLDGGHIAYALFDKGQLRIAPLLHWGLLGAFAYNYFYYASWAPGAVWLLWFVLLHGFRRLSGGQHPPTEPGELTIGRKAIGALCLLLFVLLFMPTPMYVPLNIGRLTPFFEQALAAALP